MHLRIRIHSRCRAHLCCFEPYMEPASRGYCSARLDRSLSWLRHCLCTYSGSPQKIPNGLKEQPWLGATGTTAASRPINCSSASSSEFWQRAVPKCLAFAEVGCKLDRDSAPPVQAVSAVMEVTMSLDEPSAAASAIEVADDVDEESLAAAMRVVPLGAGVLAGSAVALLVLGYLAIYLLVFLPRGTVG